MNKDQPWKLYFLAVGLAVLAAVQFGLFNPPAVQAIPYSQFLQLLDQQKVSDLHIEHDRILGRLQEPINGHSVFTTVRVDPALSEQLGHSGVAFSGVVEDSTVSTVVGALMPLLMMLVLWYFLFHGLGQKQGLGGLMGVGKSRARVYVEHDTQVTFADVAGIDDVKGELTEIVSFLKNKAWNARLGAHVPKGTLLVGPPGTGKTLVARAIAGEAAVPFFSISGSEFVEMFVGVGAARVRDLFDQARQAAPCIIFIDKLDALGKMRGVDSFGGNDEKEQTLNQLLAELDGFDPREGVVLLAATNRPEVLDPALLRAGRFDRQILIDRPDRKGRLAILKVHLHKIIYKNDLDCERIAEITPGLTGADLANLVNEAAIVATRRSSQWVELQDFTAAVERLVAGVERKGSVLRSDERQVVAYHEMGHALAASSLPAMDPVHKVSIIPRAAGSLGYTLQRPTDDRFLISAQMLRDRLVVLMAGRATDIARQLVTRFGMNPVLGQPVLERQQAGFLSDSVLPQAHKDYSEQTAREIDLAIRGLLEEAYGRARSLLEQRLHDLYAGARLLLAKESITPEEFPALLPQASEPATYVLVDATK
ncbi:Cell division protein FtsH [Pseudomonas sp. XWY-1]|uniref:ATP-dependent metallopeptidase FtsH/Yme1/Tma family protein n=1 Tax=Pseudomonas sp. XWY-1 TaxID=2069256 RepID=UPI000CDC9E47|nr:FtsH/Yme1/Tma family ATP-dependent metallopeptidase [Pseudomonas sp. XWY-1]AUZ59288.1 Cell division protein FtsH [Pseudomonas sp. XWY-1]